MFYFDVPCTTADIHPDGLPKLELRAILFMLKLSCDEAEQVLTSQKKLLSGGIVNGSLLKVSSSIR
jgi:hypothetical protein